MIDLMTRTLRRGALLAPLLGLLLGFAVPAEAGVVARINLSSQRMDVFVNGSPRHSWPVSTARRGYRTPTGTFKPQSLAVWHRSTIYSGSPMPHSIFFHGGYAIHGSYETKYLGRPASHGCVRLHPAAAAQLFSLVRKYGSGNTVIKITY
jgi:lipoprotein-anchoring transpeptidase ErfK/SrfK